MLADDKVRMFRREAFFFLIFLPRRQSISIESAECFFSFYFVYCIITHSTVPSMLSRMSLRGGSEKKEQNWYLTTIKSFCVVLKKFPVTTLRLVLGVVNAENELHGADPGTRRNECVLCHHIFQRETLFHRTWFRNFFPTFSIERTTIEWVRSVNRRIEDCRRARFGDVCQLRKIFKTSSHESFVNSFKSIYLLNILNYRNLWTPPINTLHTGPLQKRSVK